MSTTKIKSVLVSTDPEFRHGVGEAILKVGRGVSLAFEIAVPFGQIRDEHVKQLRAVDPELVVLDLGEDPVLGLKFAQFLTNLNPTRRLIAAGPTLPQERLVAAMRAGVADYLVKPVGIESLGRSIEGVARRIGWAPNGSGARQTGKLYALFGPKGGSGTTTLAINLAIQLHHLTGKQTLLVDLDLELGEIALLLGVEPRFHFVDMVRNFHRMDPVLLASYIERHESGVHVLSAAYHPQRVEVPTEVQIAKILAFLRQHYDYVIVDPSRSFSAVTLAALEQADRIFLVSTAELPALRNVARCLPQLQRLVGESEERIQLILNRHDSSDVITPEDIRQTLGLDVYGLIANDYDSVIRSISASRPIVLGGTSRYGRDLEALVAKIAGLRSPEDARRVPGIRALVGQARRASQQAWQRIAGRRAAEDVAYETV